MAIAICAATARRKSGTQNYSAVRRCAGETGDCTAQDLIGPSCSLWKGIRQAVPPSRRAIANIRRSCRSKGKILNTEVLPMKCWPRKRCMIFPRRRYRSDSDDLSQLRYGKISRSGGCGPDGLHIATLLCALFVRTFPRAGEEWSCLRRATAAVPYRFG